MPRKIVGKFYSTYLWHEIAHTLNKWRILPDRYIGYLCQRFDEKLGVFDE